MQSRYFVDADAPRVCGAAGDGSPCNAPATHVAFFGVAHYAENVGDAFDCCARCSAQYLATWGSRGLCAVVPMPSGVRS